jgi:hypothetical protein
MPVYPISFCIPEETIVQNLEEVLANKKQLEAFYQPGQTYAFNHPEPYFKMYQEAFFGKTKKKGGWDCWRHLEILGNGCLPVFENLENLPKDIMTFYPKAIMYQANMLYEKYNGTNILLLGQDKVLYDTLVRMSIQHLKEHLTTISMAKHVLKSVLGTEDISNIKSILFLGSFLHVDFQRCLLLHGFKRLFGSKCVDVIRMSHLYTSCNVNEIYKYGLGFGFIGLLPDEYDTECDRTNIEERIRTQEFDLIIYGSLHRGLLYIDDVLASYPRDKIVYIDGEDCSPLFTGENHDHDCRLKPFAKKGHMFIREYSGSQ